MRVVSLVPSLTELLFQLGAGEEVVARTRFCIEPKGRVERVEAVGGTKDPDVGRIAALRPDLVVSNADENKPEHVEALRAAGLRVLHTDTDDLDRVERTVAAIGEAVGRRREAEAHATRIRAARAQAKRDRPDPALSVVVPVWRKPLVVTGPHTYLEDLLAHCGFRNLVKADTKWPTLERLTQHGIPDAVLLPTEPFRWKEEHRTLWVKEGVAKERVAVVDGQLATWFGSRTAQALPYIASLAKRLAGARTG